MNHISRRSFLRAATTGALGAAAAGALAACSNTATSTAASSAAAVYTPGTYTATAKGMNDVTVTMTFSETAITEVKVDTANETLDLAVNSAEDFQTMLMEAQNAEIDGVSGATVTSNAVKEAALWASGATATIPSPATPPTYSTSSATRAWERTTTWRPPIPWWW